MKYKILLEQLKNLPYFTKNTIFQLAEQYKLKNSTIDTYIARALKHKIIISLKNGLYIYTDFYNNNIGDISYSFYLANIMRQPSYISSWTALQYYNLTTETIYAIISVTPKITHAYRTKAGNFCYQTIKKELFSNFVSVEAKFSFLIATPSKALFDLLYFKTKQFRGMKIKDIRDLIEEMRIDFDEISRVEQDNFFSIIKKYVN